MISEIAGAALAVVQTTSHIAMVEPTAFHSNPETAITNPHQADNPKDTSSIQQKALAEHQNFQKMLREKGIELTVFKGKKESPDDLFCNNWIMIRDGHYSLFPMLAPNRRIERRSDILVKLGLKQGIDYTIAEQQQKFLESTGSLVLDHKNKVAYAALSPRTHPELVHQWAKDFGYEPVVFTSYDKTGKQEYHTNVMMFIGTSLAGVCLENIAENEREKVKAHLSKTHTLLELTPAQITHFAGNALEVHNAKKARFLVMSKTGYTALTAVQKELIRKHVDDVITPDLKTIETYGGGSARCLMLEKF